MYCYCNTQLEPEQETPSRIILIPVTPSIDTKKRIEWSLMKVLLPSDTIMLYHFSDSQSNRTNLKPPDPSRAKFLQSVKYSLELLQVIAHQFKLRGYSSRSISLSQNSLFGQKLWDLKIAANGVPVVGILSDTLLETPYAKIMDQECVSTVFVVDY